MSIALSDENRTAERLELPPDLYAKLSVFTSLRYLAVPMPRLVLTEPSTWSLYEVSLQALSTLSLQALRIVNLPTVSVDFFLGNDCDNCEDKVESMNKLAYKTKLKDFLCSRGFMALASERQQPPTVIFKGYGYTWCEEDARREGHDDVFYLRGNTFCFFPAKQSNMFGAVGYGLEEVTEAEACYCDPDLREIVRHW